MKIFSLKNLTQNSQEMGYIKAPTKTSRWQLTRSEMTFRSTGRSTGQRSKFDCCACRSTARSTAPRTKEQRLSGRSTARSTGATREWVAFNRSTGPRGWLRARPCARPVDRSGRPAPGPVDRLVDRQSLAKLIFRT